MYSAAQPITHSDIVLDGALRQALPLADLLFGGCVLLLVIMCHAFFIRLITSSFLKRSEVLLAHPVLWRDDLLFVTSVIALLTVHLFEIFLWTAALVFSEIVPDWSQAGYFAANCYTALGEPFSLPHAWRVVPPIIAISGIFTFAWTASVLVDFVARFNDLRARRLARRQQHTADG